MDKKIGQKKVLEQKVVAVLAEGSPIAIIDAARSINGQAEILKLRFDCLEGQYQNNKTIRYLREALPNHSLMISIRHGESVPPERVENEGFKPTKFREQDYERIDLLRDAAQELGIQYFEIEHTRRKGFILFGGERASKSVVLYTNHRETPTLEKLSEIRADIIRKGANYIVFETLVKNRDGDK